MKKLALINEKNKVDNIVVAGPDYKVPEGLTAIELLPDEPVSVGWDCVKGKIVIPPPDIRPVIELARLALERTDSVALRCLKAGIPFPAEWAKYTKELRKIVTTEGGEIPKQPDYPIGS